MGYHPHFLLFFRRITRKREPPSLFLSSVFLASFRVKRNVFCRLQLVPATGTRSQSLCAIDDVSASLIALLYRSNETLYLSSDFSEKSYRERCVGKCRFVLFPRHCDFDKFYVAVALDICIITLLSYINNPVSVNKLTILCDFLYTLEY